jgi:hypothetical protein
MLRVHQPNSFVLESVRGYVLERVRYVYHLSCGNLKTLGRFNNDGSKKYFEDILVQSDCRSILEMDTHTMPEPQNRYSAVRHSTLFTTPSVPKYKHLLTFPDDV